MSDADAVLAEFWATFAGDPLRHQIWEPSWSPPSWHDLDAPPSSETLEAALRGGPAVGACFLTDDSATHVAAVDVDAPDGWPIVLGIARTMLDAGVSCYVEHSRRGGHIRVILDTVISAVAARRGLMAAVQMAGFDPADAKIELRPDRDRKTSPFAGGKLRLPYMRHPATGEIYPLLDPATETPIGAKASAALLALDLADAGRIVDLAERYIAPMIEVPTIRRQERAHDQDETVTAVLARLYGVVATPGRSIRCPLHDDHNPSMRIAPDDRRAWCHSTGCIANEGGRGVTAWRLAALAEGRAA